MQPTSFAVSKATISACLFLVAMLKGRCAILVFRIAVGALGEQQFDYFAVAVGGGLVQRCPAVIAGEIDIGAAGYQLPDSDQVAACGGLQQRCQAMFADSVHIGAFFDAAVSPLRCNR